MSRLKKDIEARKARKILRRAAVRQRTGLSDTTIWRYEREGKFPKRVVLSETGLVGWFEDEIDQWVHERVRGFGVRPKLRRPSDDQQPRVDAPAGAAE